MLSRIVPRNVSQTPTTDEAGGSARNLLMEADAGATRELEQLRALQAEHIRARVSLELSTHALRERVKELNCLYSISAIAERPDLSLDEAIQQVADILPAAWQYPEVACGRIVIDDKTYPSATFAPVGDHQSQTVTANGEAIGFVEIRYLEPRPASHEGPFLAEERSLINAIASRIGEVVERRRARAAIVSSLEKNRALLAAIPDLIVQLRHDGVLLDYHVGDYRNFGESLKSMVGRDLGELFGTPGLFHQRELRETGGNQDWSLTESPQVLQRQVALSGKRYDFEIRLVETSDRNTLGILRDITQRNRLEREILEISGREQRRIGRELHDGLCQHLAGIGFLAQALARRVPKSDPALAQDATELANLLGEAISLAKGLTRGLIPVRLETEGLAPALQELTGTASKLFGVDCHLEEPFSLSKTDSTILLHLYRIAQEALNNAIKHGRASQVTISIAEESPWACLAIKDNGKGFSVGTSPDGGLGLGIMRYRAMMLGGTLSVQSDAQGTYVLCRFPASNHS